MAFLPRFFGVILILCMLMLVSVPAPPISHKPPPPGGYRMALFWPPGSCYVLGEDCDKGQVSDDSFTAHGLWPSKPTGRTMDPPWVGNPGWKTKFTPIEDDLKVKLAPYWKTYKKGNFGDAENFWKYEWNKHGENGHFSQDDYFNRAADLTEEYGKKLFQILEEKGITPKHINEGGYQLAHIEAALLQGLGNIEPEIACPERDGAPGIYVLTEIRLILDSNAKQLRNATSKKCEKQVIFFLSKKSLSENEIRDEL